jgi:hypothetical protein
LPVFIDTSFVPVEKAVRATDPGSTAARPGPEYLQVVHLYTFSLVSLHVINLLQMLTDGEAGTLTGDARTDSWESGMQGLAGCCCRERAYMRENEPERYG